MIEQIVVKSDDLNTNIIENKKVVKLCIQSNSGSRIGFKIGGNEIFTDSVYSLDFSNLKIFITDLQFTDLGQEDNNFAIVDITYLNGVAPCDPAGTNTIVSSFYKDGILEFEGIQ